MAKKRDETPEERVARIRQSEEFMAFMDQHAAPRPGRVRIEHRTPEQPGDVPGPMPEPDVPQYEMAAAFLREMAHHEHPEGDQEAIARDIDRLLRAFHNELAARQDRERRRRALRHGFHLGGKTEYHLPRDIKPDGEGV